MQTYLVQQRIRPLVNQYVIYEADANGEAGQLIGFAQQKRFAFKEKFTIYTDESKQTVAFEIEARQVLDFGARYDVRDGAGNTLGTVGKNFKSSLLRSTWHIYRPGQEETPALVVKERSPALAVVRRIWEILPYLGDIPFFVKYHFDFTTISDPTNQQIVASYEKTTIFRDHYKLTVQDGAAEFDPRVLLALGIMLDALQSR